MWQAAAQSMAAFHFLFGATGPHAHEGVLWPPPRSAEQKGVNVKKAKKYKTTKLVISGGKLAQPSAPFSIAAFLTIREGS